MSAYWLILSFSPYHTCVCVCVCAHIHKKERERAVLVGKLYCTIGTDI
jgi:hypothetical protein